MRTLTPQAYAMSRRGKGALMLLAALYGVAFSSPAIAAPGSHTIVIEAMQFTPQVLEVKAGDTVKWINRDAFPHNAVSATKGFKSKTLAPNASWKFTVRKKGSFAYTCTLHPMMMGRLIVK